jgi:hydroxymethylpyrimidine pyrophosphatase-like HAD family hydrolase
MTFTDSRPRGLIGLDIDGTTASKKTHRIPLTTLAFLQELHQQGWCIAFITGRNFTFCRDVVASVPFPYLLAVQNGATVLEMPFRKLLRTHYVEGQALEAFGAACALEQTDMILYAGYEHGDQCFYRPQHFLPELQDYLARRQAVFQENWVAVESFEQLSVARFASVKCFGSRPVVQRIKGTLAKSADLHLPIIKDPFDHSYCVGQATHCLADKGRALREIHTHLGSQGPCIAAGDDLNDEPLLQAADIAIAMGQAPQELKDLADVQAPSIDEEGIIEGLREAMKRVDGC